VTDEAKRRLHSKVDRLTGPETVVVERVVDMVLTPIDQWKPGGTWLNFDEWMEAFLAQIKAHHSISNEPLSRTDFEAAFNNACAAVGWVVHPSTSATNRFYDTVVEVPGRGRLSLSLKASSAKGMSTTNVHISKLTEAAWVQDARTQAARRDRLVNLFQEYRATTNSIIMLRGFRQADGGLFYELVEIPTSLFASVDHLTVAQAQLATIPLPPGTPAKDADLRIRVDRSDAKITITGIKLSATEVHGRWQVPPLLGTTNDPDEG
jgi:hypothetical protein